MNYHLGHLALRGILRRTTRSTAINEMIPAILTCGRLVGLNNSRSVATFRIANDNFRLVGIENASASRPFIGILNAKRCFTTSARYLQEQTSFSTEGERKIYDILKLKFPLASEVQVQDISGGCGSMYEIYITSSEVRRSSLALGFG